MTQQEIKGALNLGLSPADSRTYSDVLSLFSTRLGRESPEKARPALPAGPQGSQTTAFASDQGGGLL